MLFTSLQWLLFLFTVFVAYHLTPKHLRRWLMLAASIAFYSSWSVPYLALIFGQLCVDWTCGHLLGRMHGGKRRGLVLATSIVVNLGVLCVFKYYGFFARTLGAVGVSLPHLDVELPLAISFYTFESMSYTIDVYRGVLKPVRSPLHLALFITWFPHLIAGPIVRPSELVPQFDKTEDVTRSRFSSGLALILIGYAKKLLVADWLARTVEPVFQNPDLFTSLEALVAVYAYAFQIYCDFSAYTDIARGASRWFGIELPENFNAPYLATSITDFWRRWHMTLSHWLRDYLYISLGGNRGGNVRTYANLMITMLLGGLWHGASWTFVVWGGLHGALLAIERAVGVKATDEPRGAALWLRRFFTFHLVCLAWVFFRAPDFASAWRVLAAIGSGTLRFSTEHFASVAGAMAIIAGYWALAPLRDRVLAFDVGGTTRARLGFAVALGAGLVILMVVASTSASFIYFQF